MRRHAIFFIFLVQIYFSLCQSSNDSINSICVFPNKKCLWKCCPPKQHLSSSHFNKCVNSDVIFPNISIYNAELYSSNQSSKEIFHLISGKLLDKVFKSTSVNVELLSVKPYLTEDGKLYAELPNTYERWLIFEADQFCVDITVKNDMKPVYLVELEDVEYKSVPNLKEALGLTIIFLLLTILPYSLCPQLRDLNGIIVITFVGSLVAVEVITLYEICFGPPSIVEALISALCYYFFRVSSFCWTNVMFYRLLLSLSYKSNDISKSGKIGKALLKYCGYSIGLPFLLTVFVGITETQDFSYMPWFVTPQILLKANQLFGAKESLYYLHIPLVLLLLINWILAITCAFEYYKKSRIIPAVLLKDSTESLGRPLYRSSQYVALLVLLTVYCIVSVLTVFCPDGAIDTITKVIFLFNISIGPLIFIIFVNKYVLNTVKLSIVNFKRESTLSVWFKKDETVGAVSDDQQKSSLLKP